MRRLLAIAMVLAACSPSEGSADADAAPTTQPSTSTSTTILDSTTTTQEPEFAVTSPVFDDRGVIPAEHTCDGIDASPELRITGLPEMTRSITVVVDDRDAPLGTWDHWDEFDIPADPGSLRIPRGGDDLGVDALNSWRLPGYMGPCPPDGEEHTYNFTIYALRDNLGLPSGVDSAQVYEAMEPDIIASVTLMGTYGR